jgi:hypothetical protein
MAAQNVDHWAIHFTTPNGEQRVCARYTEPDALKALRDLREAGAIGATLRTIGKEYGYPG